MELKDTLTVIALVLGPALAVVFTLWWQGRKEKRDTKIKLFFTLFSNRKAFPPDPIHVQALNSIDLIFHDSETVVGLWHEYFALLCRPNLSPVELEQRNKKYLDLLAEIAASLGYKSLRQTSIDDFYNPNYFGEKNDEETRLRKELLKYFEKVNAPPSSGLLGRPVLPLK